MADVDVVVEPVPSQDFTDLAVTIDPFVAHRRYEILEIKPAFVVVPNNVAPVVSNLSPAAGQAIAPTQAISFDVTDDEGLFRRILVAVIDLETGLSELVHDGDTFLGYFLETSRRTLISGGVHYDIVRKGGWIGDLLEVKVWAIDQAGNEGTL